MAAEKMPDKIRNLLLWLNNELTFLRDKLALLGKKLGLGSKGEVKLVLGVTDEGKLTVDVGWV